MKNINIKLILIGDSGVGKTTLLKRKVDNIFVNDFVSTIGVDFVSMYYDKKYHKLKAYIWDTAGQEKFKSITEVYYRDLTAALIFYDITNRESYNNIEKWINKLKEHNSFILTYIIGTKSDLELKREVFEEDLKKYKNDNIILYECSSKTNHNIDYLFDSVIDSIYTKILNKEILPNIKNNGVKIYNRQIEILDIEDNALQQKGKCCTIL
jgi:small GTP-binding protein